MSSIGELPSGQRGATEAMADAKEFAVSTSSVGGEPTGCKPGPCLPQPPNCTNCETCTDCASCRCERCTNAV